MATIVLKLGKPKVFFGHNGKEIKSIRRERSALKDNYATRSGKGYMPARASISRRGLRSRSGADLS